MLTLTVTVMILLMVSADATSAAAAPLPGREGAEGVVWLQSVLPRTPPRSVPDRRRLRGGGDGCYCSARVLLVHNHRRGP